MGKVSDSLILTLSLFLILLPESILASTVPGIFMDIYFTDGSVCKQCNYDLSAVIGLSSVVDKDGNELIEQYRGKKVAKAVPVGQPFSLSDWQKKEIEAAQKEQEQKSKEQQEEIELYKQAQKADKRAYRRLMFGKILYGTGQVIQQTYQQPRQIQRPTNYNCNSFVNGQWVNTNCYGW